VQKIIGVTELQRRFRSVLDEVVQQHTPYVLARGSRPEAVLIAYDDYVRLQKLDQDIRDRFDLMLARLAEGNAKYSDEEVAADVAAAVEEVAREMSVEARR
jgi:prevent-host-death family protein